MVAWELEGRCWRRRPERPAVTGYVIYPVGVTEALRATYDKHLAVEHTRHRAEVIQNKRIRGQWCPAVGSNVVGCELVTASRSVSSLCAVDQPGSFVQSARGPLARERHRSARLPRSCRQIHAVDRGRDGPIIHTAKHVQVSGSLGKTITHDRCRIRGPSCPRPGCAVGRPRWARR